MNQKTGVSKLEIPPLHRAGLCFIGLAFILFAIWLLYSPPTRDTTETDAKGTVIRLTAIQSDTTIPFVVGCLTGAVLLVFGINGLKITRVAAGTFSAETEASVEKAQDFYRTSQEDREERQVEVQEKIAPEPTEPPVELIKTANGDFAVFKLADLPSTVIKDALTNWPDRSPPDDMGSFEFATRKTGKGNHPWTLKFRGKKAVVVSYGGQAKGAPTVKSA